MAYGTYDNELKYYGKLIWILNKTPRSSLTTVFMHDISQINIEPGEPLNENIISSIARRNPFTKLQMINCFNSTLETDLLKDLTNLISFNYMRIFPSQFIPIIKASDGKTVPFISTSHLDVGFHLESGQEFYQSKFARGRKKNNNPSFDLVTSYSLKGLLGCSYEYWKLKFSMEQYLQTNPFGFNKYKIEAGKTFGIAPWPLLNIMNGNETYGSNSNAYNMMNYYEFVADEYVSLASEQHLQGMILNYLPLIRKLKLREVLSVKAVAGRLSRKNTEDIFLPSFMQSLDKPYIEAGFGIENIFKFVRFDALWRLTYTRNPDVQIFGIRARLQFML